MVSGIDNFIVLVLVYCVAFILFCYIYTLRWDCCVACVTCCICYCNIDLLSYLGIYCYYLYSVNLCEFGFYSG